MRKTSLLTRLFAPLGSQSGYPGHVGPPLQAVAEQFSTAGKEASMDGASLFT